MLVPAVCAREAIMECIGEAADSIFHLEVNYFVQHDLIASRD
jgi:hypothetical protein